MSHMATWTGNSYWFAPDGAAAVAYRVSKGIAFTVSDPIASPSELDATVRGFSAYCEQMGWVPVLYSVHDDIARLADRLGWAKTPVGTEAVLDLATFSLSGRHRQDLRTATNRARREGITAVWTTFGDLTAAQRERVEAVCAGWAGQKRLPEMGFTLGGIGELDDDAVRLMLAVGPGDVVHAVTSWLPSYRDGELIGWTLDVMRRSRTAMPGVMEFLISAVAQRSREAGLDRLSLSGTPLAPHEKAPATALDRVIARLARLLEPAYGFGSLRSFKNKFQPVTQRLWMIYPSGLQLGRIGPALATTYVPELRPRHLIHVVRSMPRSVVAGSLSGPPVS